MLKELIDALIQIAAWQPNVWTIYLNDVFKLNNRPNITYAAVCIAQDTHQGSDFEDSDITFNLVLYYVDRLTDTKDNELDVQSAGIDTLQNILRMLENEQECEVTTVSYTTFTQRFKDECAGAFARVTIKWPKKNVCEDAAEGDFSLDFSDDFFVKVRRS